MCEKHARKGRLVYVSGKLQTRRWRKDGEESDRFSTEILLAPGGRVQFLDRPNGANGSSGTDAPQAEAQAGNEAAAASFPAVDFNSSLLSDVAVDKGNRDIVDRMNALGFTDCLSHYHGEPVPTFQHRDGWVLHQIDYCYANRPTLDRLVDAPVLSQAEGFDRVERLSDHLSILCDFN